MDAVFWNGTRKKTARQGQPESDAHPVTASQLAHLAYFIGIARRLPPPYTIEVKLTGHSRVAMAVWRDNHSAGVMLSSSTRTVRESGEAGVRLLFEKDFKCASATTMVRCSLPGTFW